MCRALLNAPMREGQEGDVDIQDVRKPVFQALLYFTYTDQLPEVLTVLSTTGCISCSHLAFLPRSTNNSSVELMTTL